jgi:hypothetical protein
MTSWPCTPISSTAPLKKPAINCGAVRDSKERSRDRARMPRMGVLMSLCKLRSWRTESRRVKSSSTAISAQLFNHLDTFAAGGGGGRSGETVTGWVLAHLEAAGL